MADKRTRLGQLQAKVDLWRNQLKHELKIGDTSGVTLCNRRIRVLVGELKVERKRLDQ